MPTLLRHLLRSLTHFVRRTLRLGSALRIVELSGKVTQVGDAEEVVSEDSEEDVEEDEGEDYAKIPGRKSVLVFKKGRLREYIPPPLTIVNIRPSQKLISVAERAELASRRRTRVLYGPTRHIGIVSQISATRLSSRRIENRNLAIGTCNRASSKHRCHHAANPVREGAGAVHE